VKITLLKNIDRIIGSTLARVLPSTDFATIPSNRPLSILLIRPGGIGDAVHLIPTVIALKNIYPDADIDILAEKRNSAIFRLCPQVRTLFNYDMPVELFAALRGKYDVVIDTEQWHRLSAVVSRLIRAKIRIGFGTNERSRLFNSPIPYSHDEYEAGSFLRLLEPLKCQIPIEVEVPWLIVPSNAAARVDELLKAVAGKRFVTIFPGASIKERRWGADRFKSLAKLLTEQGVPIVVVGSDEDSEDGDEIVRGFSGINIAGKTSLLETAAAIDRCAVLVSGDSGILHIGVALGISTVSMFGSGIAQKWAPRGANNIVLNKHLSCSPCTKFGYTPECSSGVECISAIRPEEVHSAVISLLNRKTP
jgi:lipopolysaccharide heptosyltransferase II